MPRSSIGAHVNRRVCVLIAAMLAALYLPVAFPQSTGDQHVLSVIRQRLGNPTRVTYNHPIIFVAEISRFGPVFQGVCKSGVSEEVDYQVQQWIYGGPERDTVHTSYINCTRLPLPSPPFTPNVKLIVYCEAPSGGFACLNPIAYSVESLHQIQAWAAEAHPTPRR